MNDLTHICGYTFNLILPEIRFSVHEISFPHKQISFLLFFPNFPQNKADVLGGFLPLLMGRGALGCLSKGSVFSPEVMAVGEMSSDCSGALAGQNPESVTHPPPSTSTQGSVPDSASALSPTQANQQGPLSPDLLPVLQSVCGQVTRLRLDAVNSPEKRRNGDR